MSSSNANFESAMGQDEKGGEADTETGNEKETHFEQEAFCDHLDGLHEEDEVARATGGGEEQVGKELGGSPCKSPLPRTQSALRGLQCSG
jgi:hypothetical protein